jgi:tRNA dimethylallyltransferase
MNEKQPRLVVILGPTGSGKSSLAMKLAEELGGEIVSADSMQVYKHMDIGTAKPTAEEQRRVRHHLIDRVEPDEPFHAALYCTLARRAIEDLHQAGKPIWIVGGTGLYIRTLTQGLFDLPPIDPAIREALKQQAQLRGAEFLHDRLIEVDPRTAARLDPRDLVRTIRALEVFYSKGVPISSYQEEHGFRERPYVTWKLGMDITREEAYLRIERRVDEMIEKGFLKEVEGLIAKGYSPQLKPMQSLGYKQMAQFLRNEIGWNEAIRIMKRDTRRYAKRQWTWFRADPGVVWRNALADRDRIFREVQSFLAQPS